MMKTEELVLTKEWDKTFPESNKVIHKKVTFVNHFGITLVADMYTPKLYEGKLPVNVPKLVYDEKENTYSALEEIRYQRGFGLTD